MASPPIAIDELSKLIGATTLNDGSAKFPNCSPSTNPWDCYRVHLARVMADITGVTQTIIYPSLQWTSGLDKGDIIVAAPALRVKVLACHTVLR